MRNIFAEYEELVPADCKTVCMKPSPKHYTKFCPMNISVILPWLQTTVRHIHLFKLKQMKMSIIATGMIIYQRKCRFDKARRALVLVPATIF